MAFLSWPGSEELYSGAAIRMASADFDRVAQAAGPGRALADVVVFVIGLDRLQPVEELELHGRRQELLRRPQQLGVMGAATQAS